SELGDRFIHPCHRRRGYAGVSAARKIDRASGTSRKYAHVPRVSRLTNTASFRTLRCWLTVGCEMPSASVRLHTQASSVAAILVSSLRGAGSDRPLKAETSRSAGTAS